MQLINPNTSERLTLRENHLIDETGKEFELVSGAYRFVEPENYTSNFGFQWNKFGDLQVDTLSGSGITSERFFKATKWTPAQLKGKIVLEAGCGAGRFTSVILNETEAELYSFDYSDSVSANYRMNGPNDRLHLFQASIYEMPFAEDSFDYIFCFGVLQFTPDPISSLQSLIKVLKPGGQLVVDFFPKKGWWTKIHAKYILRPYTSKLSNERLLKAIENNIDWLMKTYRFFSRLGLNRAVNRFLPICDIDNTIPKGLAKEKLRQWVVLDTFNMLSPAFDNPLKMEEVIDTFRKGGLSEIEGEVVPYSGGQNHVSVVRGIK
ncbi:class I SAM-dependent methyltransferase [Marinoscillum sp. 108]|uniref:class I SAM-dependent methyltransferase n=1 Tax=Marinoscillum sp. 108 TaxID=2653151 RepID=UPI0012F44429|nr:class I SAM-dependent methyltransferase [Marinoscillum sp. 108]VXD20503.1 Methyltransferase domain-containing protein [Marinoscillum sp. 108]